MTVSQHFLRVNTTQNNRKQRVFTGFHGVTHKNLLIEHTKTQLAGYENIDYIIMEMPTNGVFDKVVKNSTEIEEVFNNSIKNPLGGRPAKEYIITLDLAKEFSNTILKIKNSPEYAKLVKKYFPEHYDNFITNLKKN